MASSALYSGPYIQVTGDIMLWNQHVEFPNYSANVIGCFKRDINNTIVVMLLVGYGVYPSKVGDNKNKLFIASKVYGTNCINDATCSGFVPLPSKYKFGGIIEGTSAYGDPNNQKTLKVSIQRGKKWYILYNGEKIGYIKDEGLGGITNCDDIGWGGIVGINAGTTGSPTQMGNGHLPSDGYSRTGAFADAYGMKQDGNLSSGEDYSITIDKPTCYDIKVDQNDDPRYTFLYGGPGC